MKTVLLSKHVITLESGGRPKGGVDGDGDIPSLGAEHLNDEGGFNTHKTKYISREFYEGMKRGIIKKNDILIVKDGATTGKVSFVGNDFPFSESAINEHVFILRGNENTVVPRYVFYYLFSKRGKRSILSDFRGATVGGISKGFTERVELPIPYQDNPSKSLVEQKRIATILDQADAIRKKRHQAIDELNNLIPAIFFDMFGDPVANSKNWPLVTLDSYGKVITGNTPSRKHPEYYGSTIEWIKSDNINTPFHFLTKATEGLSEAGKAVGRIVPRGSTLVTCIAGSPSCIGNAAMADRDVAFNQQINAICPSGKTDEYFLYHFILMIKKLIQKASTASMKGMVSKSAFSAIRVISIPSEIQVEFGKKMKQLIHRETLHHQTMAEADDLFNSLVHLAFKGEL